MRWGHPFIFRRCVTAVEWAVCLAQYLPEMKAEMVEWFERHLPVKK
jgi:hypothetical protein